MPSAELNALAMRKIEALHRYNEVKDLAQKLLGMLAEMSQCSVRDLHKQFGVE